MLYIWPHLSVLHTTASRPLIANQLISSYIITVFWNWFILVCLCFWFRLNIKSLLWSFQKISSIIFVSWKSFMVHVCGIWSQPCEAMHAGHVRKCFFKHFLSFCLFTYYKTCVYIHAQIPVYSQTHIRAHTHTLSTKQEKECDHCFHSFPKVPDSMEPFTCEGRVCGIKQPSSFLTACKQSSVRAKGSFFHRIIGLSGTIH